MLLPLGSHSALPLLHLTWMKRKKELNSASFHTSGEGINEYEDINEDINEYGGLHGALNNCTTQLPGQRTKSLPVASSGANLSRRCSHLAVHGAHPSSLDTQSRMTPWLMVTKTDDRYRKINNHIPCFYAVHHKHTQSSPSLEDGSLL